MQEGKLNVNYLRPLYILNRESYYTLILTGYSREKALVEYLRKGIMVRSLSSLGPPCPTPSGSGTTLCRNRESTVPYSLPAQYTIKACAVKLTKPCTLPSTPIQCHIMYIPAVPDPHAIIS